MGVSRRAVKVKIPAKDDSGSLARPVDFMMKRAVRSGRDTMFFEFSLFPQLTVARPDAIHRVLEADDRVLYIAVAETYPGISRLRLRLAGVDNSRVVEAARFGRFWVENDWQRTNNGDPTAGFHRYVRGDLYNWMLVNCRRIVGNVGGDRPFRIVDMARAIELPKLLPIDGAVTQWMEHLVRGS